MGYRTEQYKQMPEPMEISAVIVHEEIGARCVEKPFRKDAAQRGDGEAVINWLGNEDDRPAHGQIEE